MSSYTLKWTGNAIYQLNSIVDYSKTFSEEKADELLDEILAFIETFTEMPLRFPECAELLTKKKMYRSALYEKYRIVFKITKSDVIILGIIHTSRNPKILKKLRKIK
jgi:plasmid stabilization system protein ParE